MKLRLITSVIALTLASTSASSIFASMNFGDDEQTQQNRRKRKASSLDTPSLSEQAYDVAYNFGNFAASLGRFSFNSVKTITTMVASSAYNTFMGSTPTHQMTIQTSASTHNAALDEDIQGYVNKLPHMESEHENIGVLENDEGTIEHPRKRQCIRANAPSSMLDLTQNTSSHPTSISLITDADDDENVQFAFLESMRKPTNHHRNTLISVLDENDASLQQALYYSLDEADFQIALTNSTRTQTTTQRPTSTNTVIEVNADVIMEFDRTMDSEVQVIQADRKKKPAATLLDLEDPDSLNRALMAYNPEAQRNRIQEVYMKWFRQLNDQSGLKEANHIIRYYEEREPDNAFGMQQAKHEKERCQAQLKNMATRHPIYNVLRVEGFTHTEIMDAKAKLFLNFYNE